MNTQASENNVVICPNNHENPEGLARCAICGLPIMDYESELELFLGTLAEQERHVRFDKENVFLGIGDQGCKLVHNFYHSWGKGLKSSEFLLIQSSGDAQQLIDPDPQQPSDRQNTSPSLVVHHLPEPLSKQVGYYGLGERLASSDPALEDRLRRTGIIDSANKQNIFLLSALGGGTGSGASPYTLERARALNPHCRSLVIAVMPAADEPDSAHFNAFCSLSHLIDSNDGVADMILLVDHDRLMEVRGVGSMGEEITSESLLSYMVATLVGATADRSSDQADPGYLAKMSRSMGIHAFVPCIAVGRSLEIFGSLTNILESALSCPLAQVDKDSIMLSFMLVQVPERLALTKQEKTLRAELNKWNKGNFPHLKGSVLHLLHSGKRSDRVDLCLLLGGTKLALTARSSKDGFDRFKAVVERESWEQEFAVTSTSVADMEKAVDSYDTKLDEMAS